MITNSLPSSLYRVEQVREMDRIAIEDHGIPGYTLMQRAASAAYDALIQHWPASKKIIVLCGAGNNGGDGYLFACQASAAGLDVSVLAMTDVQALQGDARQAAMAWHNLQGKILSMEEVGSCIHSSDVLVDALLGTGVQRDVEGDWLQLIEWINDSGKPVLSIDIPSGLQADTGVVMGIAVRANVTVSYIGLKQGCFTAQGPEYSGKLVYDDLQIPPVIFEAMHADTTVLAHDLIGVNLPARKLDCHKGLNGHVLVVGGDHGMSGAVQLAASGAARAGAGLVSIATRRIHHAVITANHPELMCHAVESAADLSVLLKKVTVVIVGPGLGQSDWGKELLSVVLQTRLPLVVDADALNLLAADPVQRGHWVLTPHPGEAARLLSCATQKVQRDRFKSVQALADQYNAVAVLKGNGSLVFSRERQHVWLCSQGNPGMATAGMGDILTGVIAALIAQGLSLENAARIGVMVHASAGDDAAKEGQRGMMATDLLGGIRRWVNRDNLEAWK